MYDDVLAELSLGHKTSHWMWFVFPQIAGLGFSEMNRRYAISSLDEARAYLAHPLLGPRLRECATLLLGAYTTKADEVLGSVDARKLRSSMTLFVRADPSEPVFQKVIERFFDGRADPTTERELQRSAGLD